MKQSSSKATIWYKILISKFKVLLNNNRNKIILIYTDFPPTGMQ